MKRLRGMRDAATGGASDRGRSRWKTGTVATAVRTLAAAAAAAVAAVTCLAAAATGARAQELADFDYENLSFRGVGFYGSALYPTTVEKTPAFGARVDMGYLGPGLRIVPHVTYWSSELQADEVRALEASVERLVDREAPPGTPPASVDLGTVDRDDLALGLDAHVVWSIPWNLLTYAGAGASVHFLNGSGPAVDDTFVEDLLDSVSAGFNLHGGLEYPALRWLRFFAEVRGEILGDIEYAELRFGSQFMIGGPAPGEERR